MLYYRVKELYDNTRLYDDHGVYIGFLVGNELYTKKELEKLLKNCNFLNCKSRCFDIVEISKKNVHWFFGARFENK